MSAILDNIRSEIDKAVQQRKKYKDLVNGKVKILNDLKAQIQECVQKVSASSFENKDIYKGKLISAEESIDQILKDSAPLINRFNRDTINLGVAGAQPELGCSATGASNRTQLPSSLRPGSYPYRPWPSDRG